MNYQLSRTTLLALETKYRELAALKRARESYESLGVFSLVGREKEARAEAMRKIATDFPGALRELEEMSSDQLEARAECVCAIVDSGGLVPLWLRIVWEYHCAIKWILLVKASGIRKRISALRWRRLQTQLLQEHENIETEALQWLRSVDALGINRYLSPHNGRLVDEVWAGLSGRFGKSVDELQALVLRGS